MDSYASLKTRFGILKHILRMVAAPSLAKLLNILFQIGWHIWSEVKSQSDINFPVTYVQMKRQDKTTKQEPSMSTLDYYNRRKTFQDLLKY